MTWKTLFSCFAILAVGACASTSTKLVSTWAAPEARPLALKKILVTCPAEEMSRRLSAEVRLAQRIPGAVTSTSVFINGEEGDPARVRARIRELGIDGVVIVRPVAIDSSVTYVPPSVTTYSTRPGLYGYWGTSYVSSYNPGYTKERTVATVEASLYAVDGEKLLWISRSQTLNPESVNSAIDSIIDANVKAMREQGLLAR